MREILEKVKNGVLDAVFPATCMGCGKEGGYICMRCEGFASEVGLICPVCGQSSLTGERHGPPAAGNSNFQFPNPKQIPNYKSQNSNSCQTKYGLDGLVSIWEYEGVMKSLLHSIKYNGVAHATAETTRRFFGLMIRDKMRFGPFLSFLVSQDICITYVPMHRKKERQRGFNQAEAFASEIARNSGKEILCALEKIKETRPQIDLAKKERLFNVKDAYVFSGTAAMRTVEKLVLVDDVWTTGATMKECCKVLKQAGVQEVWGFTVARTP